MVVNPPSPDAPPEIRDVQVAAQANGLQLRVFNASTVAELDTAFTAIEGQRLDGLLMGGDPFFLVQSGYIVERIARIGLIAVHPFREFAEASGLMSYGTNIANTWRQVGIYSGRILKGAQPADLPVMQPTTFDGDQSPNSPSAGTRHPAQLARSLRRSDRMRRRACGRNPHCSPASLTTGHHSRCSTSMKRAKSSPKRGRNGEPVCASRAFTSGASIASRTLAVSR